MPSRLPLSAKCSAPNLGQQSYTPSPVLTQADIDEWTRISTPSPGATLPPPARQLNTKGSSRTLRKNPPKDAYLQLPDLPFITDENNPDFTTSPSLSQQTERPIRRLARNAYKSLTNLRPRTNSTAASPQIPLRTFNSPLARANTEFFNESDENFFDSPPASFDTPRLPYGNSTTSIPQGNITPRLRHYTSRPTLASTSRLNISSTWNSRTNLVPPKSSMPPLTPNPDQGAMDILRRELASAYAAATSAREAAHQEREARLKAEQQLSQMMARDKANYEKIRGLEMQVPFVESETKEVMQWLADIHTLEKKHVMERNGFLMSMDAQDADAAARDEAHNTITKELKTLRKTITALNAEVANQLVEKTLLTANAASIVEAAFRHDYKDVLEGYVRVFDMVDSSYLAPTITAQDRATSQWVRRLLGRPMPDLDDTARLYQRLEETVERFEKDHLTQIRAGYLDKATQIDFGYITTADLVIAKHAMAQAENARLLGMLPEIRTDNPAYKAGVELVEKHRMDITPDTSEPDARRKNLLVESVLAFQEAVRVRRSLADALKRGDEVDEEEVEEGVRKVQAALEGVERSVRKNGILVHEDGTWTEVVSPDDIPENPRGSIISTVGDISVNSSNGITIPSLPASAAATDPDLSGLESYFPSMPAPGTRESNIHPALRGLTGIAAQRINSFETASSAASLSGTTLRSSNATGRLPPTPPRMAQVPRRTSSITALRNATRTPLPQSPNTSGVLRPSRLNTSDSAAPSADEESEMSLLEMLSSPPLASEAEVPAPAGTLSPRGESTPPKKPRPSHTPLVAAVPERLASPLLAGQPFGTMTPRLRQESTFGSLGASFGAAASAAGANVGLGLGIFGFGNDAPGSPKSPRSPADPDVSVSSLRSKFSVRSKGSTGSRSKSLTPLLSRNSHGSGDSVEDEGKEGLLKK
ncbi:hypothetical protein BJ508DRAFT_24732 [Ascobolus immersus RN42]|uniref:Uncharacterized protein n=1 Tax=Ascobolus immersus RN42 TaxID=1160509 RepID=A0A3N4HSV7_ASCIM|nr:hypothetical protein BJ508DRAFT_24732 [Ascobolus immersus RN42]